jgi:hypothetical protein
VHGLLIDGVFQERYDVVPLPGERTPWRSASRPTIRRVLSIKD